MSIKSKFKTFFFLDDDYAEVDEDQYEEEYQPQPERKSKPVQKQNVVSLQSIQQSSKVILIEPRVYAEAQDIADELKNRKAVVVNLQRIEYDQAKRIVDFLSGTVYAIGGDIQKIGTDIFLCTPDNIEVSGTISELLSEKEFEHSRW
ncbi:cell division protein SepF [Niallia sp. Krafla_26]|uniref:cell division protein SepF n=1 Tax=Niallia sp. Krafla_26 TaxID=3064703 RepID=UPI003D16E612